MVYSSSTESWQVTAASRTGAAGARFAQRWAQELRLTYARRGNQSWVKMQAVHGQHNWLVCHPLLGLSARLASGQSWRWHPGLAKTRMQNAAMDPLVRTLGLSHDSRVLDVNLGQGHDALVLARAGFQVHGLEIDPVIHAMTADGLRRWPESRDLAPRITTERSDHGAWLTLNPTVTWDAVVFSPMFVQPQFEAEDLRQLRQVADTTWPSAEVLAAAARVAPVVVVKLERGRHPSLPWRVQYSGGKRRVVYARLIRDEQGGLLEAQR